MTCKVGRAHGYAGLASSASELARRCFDIRSAARRHRLFLPVVLIEDRFERAWRLLLSDLACGDIVFVPTLSVLDDARMTRVRLRASVRTANEPVYELAQLSAPSSERRAG